MDNFLVNLPLKSFQKVECLSWLWKSLDIFFMNIFLFKGDIKTFEDDANEPNFFSYMDDPCPLSLSGYSINKAIFMVFFWL